jgi:asparagine synthase (glutamine-hydrolysing)
MDETSNAQATANQLGLQHEILPLISTDEPQIDDLVSAYAEPFACASALGMLGIARVARTSATVLLTGDGGDDVFLAILNTNIYGLRRILRMALRKCSVML